jgi:hypothetical protein
MRSAFVSCLVLILAAVALLAYLMLVLAAHTALLRPPGDHLFQ